MKDTILCIPVRGDEVLLGIKKQKLDPGKYNAFGGHVEKGESIDEAAIRELQEEAGIYALKYEKVGEITYYVKEDPQCDEVMHIYLVTKWIGDPAETDEMTCEWFSRDKIPYDKMWDNDRLWLPHVLNGEKVKGTIVHNKQMTLESKLDFSNSF